MNELIDTLLMIGALVAAGGVLLMCAVGLVVWIAGGKIVTRK